MDYMINNYYIQVRFTYMDYKSCRVLHKVHYILLTFTFPFHHICMVNIDCWIYMDYMLIWLVWLVLRLRLCFRLLLLINYLLKLILLLVLCRLFPFMIDFLLVFINIIIKCAIILILKTKSSNKNNIKI